MQIRASIHLNGTKKNIVLVTQENETEEHLALKLAAYILFFDSSPMLDISSKHPLFQGQEFRPDLIAFHESGDIKLWVECGNASVNKLSKLVRRNPGARVLVLRTLPREARNMRENLADKEINNRDRIEIWTFPEGVFEEWFKAMADSVEVFGELSEKSFNLVANGVPFSFDFVSV